MGLVALRRELESRGWDCPVMNLNENRRVLNPECIDVQNGRDYLRKVWSHVWRGYAVQIRVNAESKKGYLLALVAMLLARLGGRPALLTYCGGHRQTFFPAPKGCLRYWAFALLFRIPNRIYCDSEGRRGESYAGSSVFVGERSVHSGRSTRLSAELHFKPRRRVFSLRLLSQRIYA
jgi:hypothetical protein